MTTPAADPSAPAAVAADPAAPAPVATPPAAASAPAPAAAKSLLPEDPGAAPAPATPPATAPKPADPNDPNAWVLAEGIQGTGERPGWFLADKYKSVAEQAKAYPELQKKFGAFTGAPKDGKYEVKLPDNVGVDLVQDHPLMGEFQKWAAAKQLNNEGFNELLGMLATYEASQIPDMGSIKADLGENADARITAAAQWAKANLGAEGYNLMREATNGPNAAAVFKVLEAVIGKTKQVTLPKPGDDVPATGPTALAAIEALQAKRGPDGRRLFETDPKHREMVERKYREYYEGMAAA